MWARGKAGGMADLIREVVVRPAFDKRDPDPHKNYGVHGAEIAFYLKGGHGAVQFVIYTNWMLPETQAETDARPPSGRFPYLFHKPVPADIGYHSHVPRYQDQTLMDGDCHVIGGPCYYDGSSLQAEKVFEIMLRGGTDALWTEMERRYVEWLVASPAEAA
jgi:hypothetical protein